MKVPFLDLKAQYETIKNEINDAIHKVVDTCAFAGGPFVESFENDFGAYCGSDYAIGVGSGTEALWISLLALGVGRGDEVITVPNTFIATAEAISLCGATPVFVDIDPRTYGIRYDLIEKHITPNTKAIIPVHIFGQSADMDPVMEIARSYGLFVIEDACQAHGARYNGQKVGTIGDMGCFSFYPGKNLGAYGEGGAIITNHKQHYETSRMIRDHGQVKKYDHKVLGWNARLDGLQGAILSVKLKYLDQWNASRRNLASFYNEILSDAPNIILPYEAEYAEHVYHVYAVQVKNRDQVLNNLSEMDIGAAIHYPIPIHCQDAYRQELSHNGSLTESEKCAAGLLSLPMFAELQFEQVVYVAESLRKIVHQ